LGGFAIVILIFSTERFEALLFSKSGRVMQHLFYFICRINARKRDKPMWSHCFARFASYFSIEEFQKNHSPSLTNILTKRLHRASNTLQPMRTLL